MTYTTSKKIIWIGFILSSVFLMWCSSTKQDNTSVVNIEQIAQCLWQKWVKMYWTKVCSHCLSQKELFGDSFKYINYVDCTNTPDACSKIKWTPTREFPSGELLVGKQKISVLAEKAWCAVK